MASKTLSEDITCYLDFFQNWKTFLSNTRTNKSGLQIEFIATVNYIYITITIAFNAKKRFVTDNGFKWCSGKSAHKTDHRVTKWHSTACFKRSIENRSKGNLM